MYLYMVNNTCVTVCPNGTYPTTNLTTIINICGSCSTGCNNCQNTNICNTCNNGYYLYNNICNTSCPTLLTIPNPTTHLC